VYGEQAIVPASAVRPGDTVLITAASSSVGLAAIDVANHIGAVPIAATCTAAKRERLLAAGAAQVIVTDEEDIAARVDRLFGLDDIGDAHRYLEASGQFGKVVVTV
jgi:NADPH:quinone reductase-like Zn-dependent oxidoreductase